MSWLSLDCTRICLQRWNVTDQDLNLSQIFSVFLFSSRSSSPYSPQPLRHEDHVLSTRVFYSNMWITRAGVQTSGRQHLQDMTYMEVSVRFMTLPEMSALYTSSHLCTFTNAHTLCHAFVLFHVLSFCSHWAHAGKIETLWYDLSLDWSWDGRRALLRGSCLRWVTVVTVQVFVFGLHFSYPHFKGDVMQGFQYFNLLPFNTHVFISS